MISPAQIYAALDATWPAANIQQQDPWLIREGQGGGQRVSAASATHPVNAGDVTRAEDAMQALGQTPLFMIHDGDTDLDTVLAARGYLRHDPVVVYAAPVAVLADPPPSPMSAFSVWPPLSIAVQLWAEAGIDAGRLAVMERAPGPKTTLLGRINDRVSGVAFVACHGKIAMLHALEVHTSQRRQGSANKMMRMAAVWAQDQGAETLCLAVTENNDAARALYASLGMGVVGTYHYRKRA